MKIKKELQNNLIVDDKNREIKDKYVQDLLLLIAIPLQNGKL